MGHKSDLKAISAWLVAKDPKGEQMARERTPEARRGANERNIRRLRQVARAVSNWQTRNREAYNAKMRDYMARRRAQLAIA